VVVAALRLGALAALALLAACAPDASDRIVTLDPLTPDASGARDAALEGEAPVRQADVAPSPRAATDMPPDVLDRPTGTGPNVVAFALATDHPVGAQVHDRASATAERAEEACAAYGSDQLAQVAFLEAGGPERDPGGLDPDGDGYACGWDPAPFRRAVR
jgi:hypothetical protein